MKNSRPTRPFNAWLPACLLGLSLAAGHPAAQAAVANGGNWGSPYTSWNGIGEMFLVVYDHATPGGEISYTLDLGVTVNNFVASYTSDAGKQQFWVVDDANWASFLSQSNEGARRWLVNGYDFVKSETAANSMSLPGRSVFTTLTQGTETGLINMNLLDPTQATGLAREELVRNNLFDLMTSPARNWLNAMNNTGTHVNPNGSNQFDFNANGSSVNLWVDTGLTAFGEDGAPTNDYRGVLSSVPAGGATIDNAIGQSSWFYRLMDPNDGADAGVDPLIVDEMDNLSADAYWGFIYVDPTLYPDSPYAGKYLLSYTLEGSSSAAALARREFAYSIGRTETTGGWRVKRLEGFASAAAGESPSWLGSQPLGVVSSVPENGTALTLLAGLGLLGAALKRRRGRAG